jgi:hypothetical protein
MVLHVVSAEEIKLWEICLIGISLQTEFRGAGFVSFAGQQDSDKIGSFFSRNLLVSFSCKEGISSR